MTTPVRLTPADVPIAPFVPRLGLGNGHLMTIFAWARRRTYPGLPPADARYFETAPDTRVLAHCYWQPRRLDRPTLLALHGLEGSSDAHYMRGLAWQAWQRGWNAVLLNQRNCGGTEHLTPGLYHSGLTHDPWKVLEELHAEGVAAFGVTGYSLGGNLTMRLAGEHGAVPERRRLPIRAVAAVSPTIDLGLCVRSIEKRANLAYEWNFMRNLKARMRRKNRHWPGAFDLSGLDSLRTIRAFDEMFTAPYHGFAGADDYYQKASAMRLIDRVDVPALIIAAEDDPFVPAVQFRQPALEANACIRVALSRSGGHCGFVSASGYWAEETAVAFIARFMPS